MTDCVFCELVKKKANLLYEDDSLAVMLSPKPATLGHLLLLPKSHAPILEKVDDKTIQEMMVVANKVGIAVFEQLGAHGTNILVQNGPAAGQTENHMMLHIIPRFENDNLELTWEAKQADEGSLESLANLIKEQTGSVGVVQKEKAAPKAEEKEEEVSEEDWRSKRFKRIP